MQLVDFVYEQTLRDLILELGITEPITDISIKTYKFSDQSVSILLIIIIFIH